MAKYLKLNPPKRGSKITVAKNGQLQVPDDPIVPFIQGEGISTEIWRRVQEVFDLSVDRCYANAKRLEWMEVYAGSKGNEVYGPNNRLPEDTVRAIQEYKVCIKGPLEAPASEPIPPDDVLFEKLDLFAHVRPIRCFEPEGAPLKNPQGIDVLVFRENTEDLLMDIEWRKGSPEAKQLIGILNDDLAKRLGKSVRPDASLAIKSVSATATKRLIRLALEYAVKHKHRSVTFLHNGKFLKQTEGFFKEWGFELARKEFAEYTINEDQIEEEFEGSAPRGRILVRAMSTDIALQRLITHPQDFDIVLATNLNGLYFQNVALGTVDGEGLMPTGYLGSKAAVFEATHSRLSKPVSPDHANPISTLLCGVMLFDHLGWKDSAELVTHSLLKTIADGIVTPDLGERVPNAKPVSTAEFCDRVIENFDEVRKSRVRQAMKRTVTGLSL
jgi:isocitrate dehydrogenase